MAAQQRVTDEQIIAAYNETRSVWQAAKRLGIVGQSVWERLKRMGYRPSVAAWTEEERVELRTLAGQCTIGEIASRLGRTYAAVASQISLMGLANNYGNRGERKLPRGSGLDKDTVAKRLRELESFRGSLRQFCRMNGMTIDFFVIAVQRYFPERWDAYTKAHSDLGAKACPYCGATFYPMSPKQRNCTRACSTTERADRSYFGGKRRATIGLSEGVCQLCKRANVKGLSSHHVFGKENDPENECLVALCAGCHKLVTLLATRKFLDDKGAWENLISLAILRRFADVTPEEATSVYVCVDLEFIKDLPDGEEVEVPRVIQLRLDKMGRP